MHTRSLLRLTQVTALVSIGCVPLLAAIGLSLSTPTPTAQVGVSYSSSCTTSGGNPPYHYSISVGALPGGLGINSGTGAITGIPTTEGVFNFTCAVTDTPVVPTARSGGIAKSGSPLASGAAAATITVAAAAPSPTPIPGSIWMAMLGLAGVGFFQMRKMRRA